MAEDTPEAPRASAETLRRMMLDKQMEESNRRLRAQEKAEQQREALLASFLRDEVSEEESAMIRRIVLRAAEEGRMEAMVYTFPSDLCTDGGRAINSGDPDWPATLQGKARSLYDRYKAVAQPAGFKLRAMIVNFPGGIPGDVGFFLSWAPEAV